MNLSNKNNTTLEAGTDFTISPGTTSASDCCNKDEGASKSNNDDSCDDVCKVNNMLHNMSTDDVSKCANCGKEGDDINNVCAKCKQVKYCNAVCKKVHKKKHKKDCEKHVRVAAEKHDEKLFKQPSPQYGDCPICFERIPTLQSGSRYMSCCGKVICSGCIHAPVYDDQGNKGDIIKQNECPFCRTVAPKKDEESIRRLKKRAEVNDAEALFQVGGCYRDGRHGFPQDYTKAFELWHRTGELGNAEAYCCVGLAYYNGRGVERDEKKGNHYFELAAMKGCTYARHNLGLHEEDNEGNMDRALKHYMIAVRSGHTKSLQEIQELYSNGFATKEDYMKALQAYQEYLVEIKSPQRDKAAAFDSDIYRYY